MMKLVELFKMIRECETAATILIPDPQYSSGSLSRCMIITHQGPYLDICIHPDPYLDICTHPDPYLDIYTHPDPYLDITYLRRVLIKLPCMSA